MEHLSSVVYALADNCKRFQTGNFNSISGYPRPYQQTEKFLFQQRVISDCLDLFPVYGYPTLNFKTTDPEQSLIIISNNKQCWLWIRDILVRIRICGSVLLSHGLCCGSGSYLLLDADPDQASQNSADPQHCLRLTDTD